MQQDPINEKEAEIVRLVFKFYNEGFGTKNIASKLNRMGYRTVSGGVFVSSTITYMLKNEKYYGRLILHKYIRNNDGVSILNDASKEPVYDWGIAHEAIVSKEEFDEAQQRLSMQKEKHKAKSNNPRMYDPFYELLICNKCQKPYVKVMPKALCQGDA